MRSFFFACAFALAVTQGPALAAPTPIPGGADEVHAVSGKIGETVFNGVLRITLVDVRDATPDEATAYGSLPAGQKLLVFHVRLRNGAKPNFIDLVEYTFADANDVAADVPTSKYTHANVDILQGAAAAQAGMFLVDQDFKPVKLIVKCATCGAKTAFRPVRFTLTQ